ncbi:MAG: hypothetical protein R3A11_06105 [Bdellovibrionota bacterium]
MKKYLVAGLVLLASSTLHAQILININQSSNKTYPLAMAPFHAYTGSSQKIDPSVELFQTTVKEDLQLIKIFHFIPENAFLEPRSQSRVVDARKINFSFWTMIDTYALIKGLYRKDADVITIEAHLYDVLTKKEIMARRYKGGDNQIANMAHAFSNSILEALTGEEGLFDTKIAFICRPKNDKELCMMHFNGDNYDTLTQHRSITLSPQWSKDGKSIYYTSFVKNKPALFRFDLDKRQNTKLSTFSYSAIGLAMDPTQDWILTTLDIGKNHDLYFLDLDGKVISRKTKDRGVDVSPSFSPDGQQFAFVSDRDGSSQVYIMNRNAKDSTAKRITFKGKSNNDPAWSPKGDKIAFAGMDTDGDFDIFTVNIDGTNMERLTYDTKNNEEPAWSPDGNFILFVSNRTGKRQVFMMRADGSKQTQLTTKDWDHFMPTWQPKAVSATAKPLM